MSNPPIPTKPCFACGKPTNETQSVYGIGHLSCYYQHGKPEADFESLIASGHYFTAGHGNDGDGATSFGPERFSEGSSDALSSLTFCALILRDGTKLVGYADSADPEEARRLAYSRAREQWERA